MLKMEEENNKDYLSPKELAQRLGFSVGALQNWRNKGFGPKFYRRGIRKIVYKIEDVEQWEIDNNQHGLE